MGTLERVYLSICPVAAVTAAGLIIYGVLTRRLTPVHGAYLVLLFAIFALTFTLFLFYSFTRIDGIWVESNWGGLGGGPSGWSISTPLVYLLIAAVVLALLVMAISSERPPADKPPADLRERYRSAVNLGMQKGIQFETPVVAGGKLLLKGTAPSQAVVNQFWDQLKLANPMSDDVAVDLTTKSLTPAVGASSGSSASSPGVSGAPAAVK